MGKIDPHRQGLAEQYIREAIPVCPLCRTPDPRWQFTHTVQMWERRIEYTCSVCGGRMSTAYSDMKGININGLTDFLQGSLSYEAMVRPIYGKKKGTVYVRVLDPGKNQIKKEKYEGVEIPLEEIEKKSWSV